LLGKALRQGHFNILRVTEAYNSVRQPFGNFVVDATRQQGRRYELSAPGFKDIEAGDIVSRSKLAELGELIKGGWEWNWKTTVDNDLERALATL
jgi:salicylate hydroxylase